MDLLNAPVAAGVEFLSDLFHDTNVQYSALSTVIPEKDGLTFGKQPIVKRLMKGIFKERPSLPKYTIVYDVDIVLNYMISLPKPEDVGLKELSIRIATLLCILSGQRSQTISRLTITFIRPSDTKIIFPIASLLKNSRPGFHQEPLEFSRHESNPNICPVFNIDSYIDRTKNLRGEEKGIFLSFVPPHKLVTSKTIARWVLSFLQDAGIDTKTFGTHSTRSASTSKALKSGMSLDDIGKAAGWSSHSTFRRL